MLTVVHILAIKLYITLLEKINNVYQWFFAVSLCDKSFIAYLGFWFFSNFWEVLCQWYSHEFVSTSEEKRFVRSSNHNPMYITLYA